MIGGCLSVIHKHIEGLPVVPHQNTSPLPHPHPNTHPHPLTLTLTHTLTSSPSPPNPHPHPHPGVERDPVRPVQRPLPAAPVTIIIMIIIIIIIKNPTPALWGRVQTQLGLFNRGMPGTAGTRAGGVNPLLRRLTGIPGVFLTSNDILPPVTPKQPLLVPVKTVMKVTEFSTCGAQTFAGTKLKKHFSFPAAASSQSHYVMF